MNVAGVIRRMGARRPRFTGPPTNATVVRSGLRQVAVAWLVLGGLVAIGAVSGRAPLWSAAAPTIAGVATWVVATGERVRPIWLTGGWSLTLLVLAVVGGPAMRSVMLTAIALVVVTSLPFARPRAPGLVLAAVLAGLTGLWVVLGPSSPWWITAMWPVSIGVSGIGAVMLLRQTGTRVDALRSVADAFSIGFLRFTATGELLDRNHVFAAWTPGASAIADVTDDVAELLGAATAGTPSRGGTFTINLRSGDGKRIEGLVRPVAGVHGAEAELVYEAIALDVTDRLHRSEAARLGQDIFLRAFSAAPIGMVVVEAGGALVQANEAFWTMVAASGHRSSNLLEFLSLEDRPHCAQLLTEPPNGYGASRREVRYLAPGETRTAILSCARLPGLWGDPPPRLIVQLVDIEDRDRATRALQDLVRDKDDFVSRISHHLRTPLTAVFGFAEELLEHGDLFDDHERTEALEYIRLEADRAASVVANLSVAARVDMSQLDVRIQPVDVLQIARQEGLRVARINDVVVQVQDGEFWVMADGGRLQHVMRNLIANAAEHARQAIEVACAVDGLGARIVVVDDGPGVEPDALERIFDPYWGAGGDRVPGPVGLGLPVARTLAQAMAGSIDYHRDEGYSVFSLWLPHAEAGQRGHEARRDVS